MQILLPTDFSKNSINTLYYALRFFNEDTHRFHFVYCCPNALLSEDYQISKGIEGKNIDTIIENSAKEKLYDLATSLMKETNNIQEFEIEVVHGDLSNQLVTIVNKLNSDLIIMGTKGETGANSKLLGSNTIQVINKRVCPVIAVPENYVFKTVKSILFPSDLMLDFQKKHVETILNISKSQQSEITLLHISLRGLTGYQRTNKAQLESLLKTSNVNYVQLTEKDIADAVYDHQNEIDLDLLVMINSKHLFFENLFFKPTVSKIASNLKTPFLVVPA